MTIDRRKATINDKWNFTPFQVPAETTLLRDMNLPSDYELIVVERKDVYRAFSMRELAYHHLAQGELAGEPFLISF